MREDILSGYVVVQHDMQCEVLTCCDNCRCGNIPMVMMRRSDGQYVLACSNVRCNVVTSPNPRFLMGVTEWNRLQRGADV